MVKRYLQSVEIPFCVGVYVYESVDSVDGITKKEVIHMWRSDATS